MTSEAEMEAVKKLTQAQKSYLVKRIDSLVTEKKDKILTDDSKKSVRYSFHPQNFSNDYVDEEVFNAIIEGKVRLNTGATTCNIIKKKASQGKIYMSCQNFMNTTSLRKFNHARNKRNKKLANDCKKRHTAIEKEASNLKDQVMLEGSLATELLEKFKNTDF